MDRRNFTDIGEEIRDIVQNAVNTMDYRQLNRDIGNTVRGALDEVRHSLGTGYGRYRQDNPFGPGPGWDQNNGRRDGEYQQNGYQRNGEAQGGWDSGRNGEAQGGWDSGRNREAQGEWNYHKNRDARRNRDYQRDREYRRDRDYQREREHQRNRENQNKEYQRDNNYQKSSSFESSRQNSSNAAQAGNLQRNQQTQAAVKVYPFEPVGKVAGILFTVFGSIGMGLFGIGAFILALIGQLTGSWGLFGTIAIGLIPLFGLSGCMAAKGSSIRKRLHRFRRYIGLFQGRPYYSIKELAAGIGQSPKFVLRDLRRMISIGMFPEGRIDDQETCLMLNRESYKQYLELQKNIRLRSEGETGKQTTGEQKKTESYSGPAASDTQIRQAIEDGRACIQQIREANDAIPGEEISRKLDRLEDVIGKIFSYIEGHPNQLADIQKFMEYYLPTTLKLINAYKEFEKQSIQGDNITSAKKEIEETLNTINLAFENLLDSLFEDVAMDVSSDISVLETLLAQEGLTQKDFISNEKMGGETNESGNTNLNL